MPPAPDERKEDETEKSKCAGGGFSHPVVPVADLKTPMISRGKWGRKKKNSGTSQPEWSAGDA